MFWLVVLFLIFPINVNIGESSPQTGYIYLLTNPSLDDIKIGYTSKTPQIRAKQLSSTGLPTPFQVYTSWIVPLDQMRSTERSIHKHLSQYRTNTRREFFDLEPDQAEDMINNFLD